MNIVTPHKMFIKEGKLFCYRSRGYIFSDINPRDDLFEGGINVGQNYFLFYQIIKEFNYYEGDLLTTTYAYGHLLIKEHPTFNADHINEWAIPHEKINLEKDYKETIIDVISDKKEISSGFLDEILSDLGFIYNLYDPSYRSIDASSINKLMRKYEGIIQRMVH